MKRRLHQYAELDLNNLFREFYDTMLSNPDFSVFFQNEGQIKKLIETQKTFLLESIELDEAQLKDRYVSLGERHHKIKIPYIIFMAGMDILEQGMIRSVCLHDSSIELIEFTFRFFKMTRAFTAKGYLNKMLEADIADIDNYLRHVQRATDIDTVLATERVIWLKNVIFAIKIENRGAAPALNMSTEFLQSIKSSSGENGDELFVYASEMAARMEIAAREIFYFIEKSKYEEVLPLYRELMSIYKLTLMLTNVATIASSNQLIHDLQKDPLTQCLTRHSYPAIMARELSISEAGQYDLSFIMMDLDNFKGINDKFGHSAGDEVLKVAAKTVFSVIRSTDYLFRMGGEEFLLILKGASKKVATVQAEIIRQGIEKLSVNVNDEQINVTASFGVAGFTPPHRCSYEKMVEASDRCLYRAKESGRNRVCS